MSLLIPDIPALARDALRSKHKLSIVLAVELIGVKFRFVDCSGRVDTIARAKRIHIVLGTGSIGRENVAVGASLNVRARLGEQRRVPVTGELGFSGGKAIGRRRMTSARRSTTGAVTDDADFPFR